MIVITETPTRKPEPITAVATQAPPSLAPRPAEALLSAPILPALVRFALPNVAAMPATALAAVAETAYVGSFGVPSLAGMALAEAHS